jgi:hypothetical protein
VNKTPRKLAQQRQVRPSCEKQMKASTSLKNPDACHRRRMTRGEKAALLLTLPVGGDRALRPSASVTSAVSRRIEYKQRKANGKKP